MTESISVERARVVRLQHVSLPFPGDPDSVATARRFFGEAIGLEERPVPPTLPGVILWYAAGDLELHLFSEPSGVAVNDASRRHPCLQVDDIVRFRAQLEAAGFATLDARRRDPRPAAVLRPRSVRQPDRVRPVAARPLVGAA